MDKVSFRKAKILVVDGNTPQINQENEDAGRASAGQSYRAALLASGFEADIDIVTPYGLSAEEIADYGPMLAQYDGFALTGSAVDWGIQEPEGEHYLAFLKQVFACHKPVIGSCWGMQSVAFLFGGASGINPAGTETGVARDIALTPQGRAHFVFEGVGDVFCAPAIHRDHVTRLPEGAVLLASNAISTVQAFSLQTDEIDYVGFQFHPELSLEVIHKGYKGRKELPNTIKVCADFPDNPPKEVKDEKLRIKPLTNWMEYVVQQAQAIAA